MNIGMIGTGAIGFPIAERIINKGLGLSFFARRNDVIDSLCKLGADYIESVENLGEASDIVLLFLNSFEQCRECTEKLLKGMNSGLIIVGSTISPDQMREISRMCEGNGVSTLSAPVTGGVKGAKDGTLTIMVSGKEDNLNKARFLFEAFGKEIVYVGGEIGLSQVMKSLVQLLVGINTVAMSEAFILGAKNGLEPSIIYSTLCKSAGVSRIFENRGCTVLERDFHKRGTIEILNKDLGYCAEISQKSGTTLMLGNVCADLFKIGMAELDREQDFSSIIKLYEKWAGVEISS